MGAGTAGAGGLINAPPEGFYRLKLRESWFQPRPVAAGC